MGRSFRLRPRLHVFRPLWRCLASVSNRMLSPGHNRMPHKTPWFWGIFLKGRHRKTFPHVPTFFGMLLRWLYLWSTTLCSQPCLFFQARNRRRDAKLKAERAASRMSIHKTQDNPWGSSFALASSIHSRIFLSMFDIPGITRCQWMLRHSQG